MTIKKSSAIRKLGLALILGIFQLRTVQVHSKKNSIRKEPKRPDREKDKVGSSYNREERPVENDVGGGKDQENNHNNDTNDTNETNNNDIENVFVENITNDQDQSLNLVLVPQCNPSDPGSFYSLSKRAENRGRTDFMEDTSSDCQEYLQYCDKKRSNVVMSWSNWVNPTDFYNTVELMYDRCFKTCAESLDGGVEEFCSMPKPRNDADSVAEYYSGSSGSNNEYCESVENSDWEGEMIAHEFAVLQALNEQRADPTGRVCTRKSGNLVTQGFFPRSSPVVSNGALRCAARIQAKNIVKATIEANRFPGNLHDACPSSDFGGGKPICERFSTRMENAGFGYEEVGFGYINEVTAAGYQAAESVIQGWLGSQSGHCEAIVKQESLVIPTEVGIGYYRDEETGRTGHVMLLGQKQL